MAFCKHCGSQYPDGGSCTNPACPAANQAAAPAPAGGNALDGGFNEALNTVKKNSKTIIAAVVAFVVLIIAIVFVVNHTGARGAANKYAKNLYKKSGFKNVNKVMLLDDVYKEYKDSDEFEDDKEDFEDRAEDRKDNDIKYKIKSVKKGKKLSGKACKSAEAYFEEQAEEYDVDVDDVDVKKGYEYKVKVQVNDDGDKDTSTRKICVVKVKGDGWKVIPASSDGLTSEYSSYLEDAEDALDVLEDYGYGDFGF